MFRDLLPANCPHAAAKEEDKYLYRIFKTAHVDESDFQSYVSIYPHREDYKKQCGAHALSFFESKEVARKMIKDRPTIGKYLARVLVKKEHGKLHLTNPVNGHYNLWVYNSFNCATLDIEIEPID